jgi:hypothetical protein
MIAKSLHIYYPCGMDAKGGGFYEIYRRYPVAIRDFTEFGSAVGGSGCPDQGVALWNPVAP